MEILIGENGKVRDNKDKAGDKAVISLAGPVISQIFLSRFSGVKEVMDVVPVRLQTER